jgi:Domain of unknown function (DUF4274)
MSSGDLDLNAFFDRKGSEAIHCFATHWNWDNGVVVLDICIQHPLCTTATAQDIFLKSEPSYHLSELASNPQKFALNREKNLNPNYDIIRFISRLVEKWNRNDFLAGIATYTHFNLKNELKSYREIESSIDNSELPWRTRDDIFEVITGKTVNCSEIDLEEFEAFF